MRSYQKVLLSIFAFTLFVYAVRSAIPAAAADKTFEPKLEKLVTGKGWKVENRTVTLVKDGGRKGVFFDEKAGVGLAWLEDYEFQDGTIEFDVKGKDVLQKSFVGIAFQAADDSIYDVVYFRPFNFKSDDPERRSHAVQYIANPDFGWKKLRDESPGKYEKAIEPAPDPDGWFHARVVISGKTVCVFVDSATKPSLVVEKLTESRKGRIGLWLGDASDGSFADLKITPMK